MKFTCNRDNLIEGINIVQKAVPTKTSMSVLEGILIQVYEELKITGNDLELGIEYEVPAIIEEIGSIVINSKTFGDIVRKLPDVYVTLETSNTNTLHITSGAAHYEIKSSPAEGYPQVVSIDTNVIYTLTEKDLKGIIKQTVFAASIDGSRPILKGVFMDMTDKNINFVAIDGYKLAIKTIEKHIDVPISVVIPTRILNEIVKVLNSNDDEIKICCNENQIMFFTDNFKFVSRLLKGEYIKYQSMIPREYKTEVNIKSKEFLYAVERGALVMNDEKKYPLLVSINTEEFVVSSNAENGSSREVVEAEVVGDALEIGFNSRNMMDCLKAVEDEKIKVLFTTNIGPCVIKGSEDSSFLYLVMPVKTRN